MRIDCYLSQGCNSESALKSNITVALRDESIEAEVNFHRIDDEAAMALGLSGSPSVFVNEIEIQPLGDIGFS